MKKFLCSITLIAFAVAVQAGETKPTTTAASQKDAKTACSAQKTMQVKATSDSKSGCCAGGACKETPSRQTLLSPKAASELAKR